MIKNRRDPRRSSCRVHYSSAHPSDDDAPMAPDRILGLRQICVQLDGSDAAARRLDPACHLRASVDATLLGVFSPVRGGAAPYVWNDDPAYLVFHDAVSERRIAGATWPVVGADGLIEIMGYARQADLTLIGQPRAAPAGQPPEGRFAHVGQNVAVAWNGSREAVRALSDALPLFCDADSVTVLEIGERSGRGGPSEPGVDAAVTFLERHGIQAFGEFIDSGGGDVLDVLRGRIETAPIDLMVAGSFHHPPTRERMLGGTSFELSARLPVPVLVSH